MKRFSDIKETCQIDFNGKLVEVNAKQIRVLNELGKGNFGQVHLVELINDPTVQFACKVSWQNKKKEFIRNNFLENVLKANSIGRSWSR